MHYLYTATRFSHLRRRLTVLTMLQGLTVTTCPQPSRLRHCLLPYALLPPHTSTLPASNPPHPKPYPRIRYSRGALMGRICARSIHPACSRHPPLCKVLNNLMFMPRASPVLL